MGREWGNGLTGEASHPSRNQKRFESLGGSSPEGKLLLAEGGRCKSTELGGRAKNSPEAGVGGSAGGKG